MKFALLFTIIVVINAANIKKTQKTEKRAIEPIKWGPNIEVPELTQFTRRSFDYDFDADLDKEADRNNAYDELVPRLPRFEKFRHQINVGSTEVPIVTRRGKIWSTPSPKIKDIPFEWRMDTTTEKAVTSKKTVSPFSRSSQTTKTTKLTETTTSARNSKATKASPTKQTKASTTSKERTNRPIFNGKSQTTIAPKTSKSANTKTVLIFSSKSSKSPSTTEPTTTAKPSKSFRWTTHPSSKRSRKPAPVWHRGQIIFDEDVTKVPPTPTTNTANPFTSKEKTSTARAALEKIRKTEKPLRSAILRDPPSQTSIPIQTTRRTKTTTERTTTKMANTSKTTKLRTTATVTTPSKVTTPAPRRTVSPILEKKNRPLEVPKVKVTGTDGRKPAPKPLLIKHEGFLIAGPTFSCPILNPDDSGTPSANNDISCALSAPGFSADGTCRCTFEVNARDERGCATGYTFTCSQKEFRKSA